MSKTGILGRKLILLWAPRRDGGDAAGSSAAGKGADQPAFGLLARTRTLRGQSGQARAKGAQPLAVLFVIGLRNCP